MAPITEPEIVPPYSPCSGGWRLVVSNVPLIPGERYWLYFVGQKRRPCVYADLVVARGSLVLHAYSPRYESPERVKVCVVNSQDVVINVEVPIEFDFMDDQVFQLADKCGGNMVDFLSFSDVNVQSGEWAS